MPSMMEFLNMEKIVLSNLDNKGKMYSSTITYARITTIRIAEEKDRPVLIIAPNTLCQQWKDDIEANKEKDWSVLVCTSKTKNTVKFKKAFEELCFE